MKRTYRPLLWFLTLPQGILAACALLQLFRGFSPVMLGLLITSALANVFFTSCAVSHSSENASGKAFYIAMAAVYTAMAAAAVPLLEGTKFIGGVLSIRLAAMLLCAIPAVYSLFGLAVTTEKGDKAKYIIGIVLVPLAFFLAFNVLSGVNASTAVMILIAASAYTSVFLTVKIILSRKNESVLTEERQRKGRTVLYIIFSITLPLIGLILNASMDNILGDFSDPVFYIVVIINGILLLTPPPKDRRLRSLKFFLTGAATLYFVYFFIVFLPYLPLGFFGLIYLVGVLLFAPAGALVMQAIYIIGEWRSTTGLWGFKRTLFILSAGLFVLPAIVLTSFIGDKNNLDTALKYVNDVPVNDLSVDTGRLRRAMDNAGSVYEFDSFIRGVEVDKNTPIISSVYSALVLGGTVIPEKQMDALKQIFFDSIESGEWNEEWQRGQDAAITTVKTDTKFDEEAGAYRTWVDLTLQSMSEWDNGEYSTSFCLPEGAYITGYYLDVSGERKLGILADDRAATQVYESIVTTKRDPGLLHYTTDNTIELRVFPFSRNEIRRTGFEILHSQQGFFILDGRTVELPAQNERDEVAVKGAVMISAKFKETLPQLKARAPEYYFIIDCSAGSDIEYQVSKVKEYAAINAIDKASVLFTSYRVVETGLGDADKTDIVPECGFNLALAVRKVLSENGDDTVPVILFASENAYDAYFPTKTSLHAKQYPEMSCYYEINDDMTVTPYSFESNKKYAPLKKPASGMVLSYYGIPVPDDGQNELVLTGETPVLDLKGGQYEDAVSIEASADTEKSLDLIRASFRAHVLTDKTAFIVVETREQERELLEIQEQMLGSDALMSARITLDEPPVIACFAAAAFAVMVVAAVKLKKRVKSR